jgi:Fe-S cluster assembly protein SufB
MNIVEIINKKYQYGFITDLNQETFSPGVSINVVIKISALKNEFNFMLKWRLSAYNKWLDMREPTWSHVKYNKIDYQSISYYSSVTDSKKEPKNIGEVDKQLIDTYNRLGLPLYEQEKLSGIAVDMVFDSVSVITTFKEKLASVGIIFCSMSEAIIKYPKLVEKYLGSVVPSSDNFFSALNSSVFSDGSFVYIPENVRCPVELSTYFRINAKNTGQFERTLIIADKNSYVSYLEGCTAPIRDNKQLHAAVVEIVALDNAEVKYSTVQNWYPGDKDGSGGIYNFVTKRGLCRGHKSKISWTQIETGSSITWKYPSIILYGNYTVGEFYSMAVTRYRQQADTGTKMLHIGKGTKSSIVSKGISADYAQNTYRGLVRVSPNAIDSRNFSQCDSLLIGKRCGAHTYPCVESKNYTSQIEHEASTSKISENQLFYCLQRCISREDSTLMIVSGFCKKVFSKLPLEFAVEAQKLMEITLEGVVA